jgi:2-(1,2-epoxy-1,2-dihydrophenyl)acetyl-CoA isomerase
MSAHQPPLLLQIDGPVATLTLNRPNARNAWDEEMVALMLDHLDALPQHPDVRVIVLTGAGSAFCAGGDLRAMQDRSGMFAGDPVELRTRYTRGLQAITRRLDHLELPIIAAINGHAIGAGLDLALMCDIRVASEAATFGSTFAAVGLIPGDGGAYLLTRAVGFSRAVELVLTARVFKADEAQRIGVAHHLVPAADVLSHAHTIAGHIASLPAPAIRMAKVALYRAYHQDLEGALQLTAALQGLVQHSAAHQDAVAAMLDKMKR